MYFSITSPICLYRVLKKPKATHKWREAQNLESAAYVFCNVFQCYRADMSVQISPLDTPYRIFGFLVPNDLIKQHPLYAETIARHPTRSDEERFGFRVCSAIASAWAFKIQPLWHKASFEMTRYGPIIQLADNKDMHTMVTPSAKVIKRMQKLIEFDVEPKWVNAD
ncbi:hypothetical protein CPB85DRAFT_924764 [Mucidula mucida]|nr:hypothetical protein CPB85DRAFT_924764 [Mucidula mucida]